MAINGLKRSIQQQEDLGSVFETTHKVRHGRNIKYYRLKIEQNFVVDHTILDFLLKNGSVRTGII